jgi:hypothetical protein
VLTLLLLFVTRAKVDAAIKSGKILLGSNSAPDDLSSDPEDIGYVSLFILFHLSHSALMYSAGRVSPIVFRNEKVVSDTDP